MQNIIEQISDILKSAKFTTVNGVDTYDIDCIQKLNILIPAYLDPNKTFLCETIKHALKLQNEESAEFVDDKLIVKRKIIIEKPKLQEQQQNTVIALEDILDELNLKDTELNQEAKEHIRNHIRARENLYEKDMILFLNQQIIIKHFNRQAEEQRFNGLPKSELDIIRNRLFETTEIEERFMAEVMQKAMMTELNFAVISGDNFQKTYIKKVQKFLVIKLQDICSEDLYILEGLGNLVLRENWSLVHRIMAKRILDLFAEKNAGAEAFLRYFKGDIVLGEDGLRYKLPEIIDDNGIKWSASMIFGMVLQQKKGKIHRQDLEVEIKDLKQKIDDSKQKITQIEKEANKSKADLEQLEQEMSLMFEEDRQREIAMKEINVALQSSPSAEQTQELKARYLELMKQSKTAVAKEYTIKSKRRSLEDIIQTVGARVNKVNQEIANYERKIKEEEAKINKFVSSLKTVNEKYNTMFDALIAALMKKRTRVYEDG